MPGSGIPQTGSPASGVTQTSGKLLPNSPHFRPSDRTATGAGSVSPQGLFDLLALIDEQACLVLDDSLHIRFFNRCAQQYVGNEPSPLLGASLPTLLHHWKCTEISELVNWISSITNVSSSWENLELEFESKRAVRCRFQAKRIPVARLDSSDESSTTEHTAVDGWFVVTLSSFRDRAELANRTAQIHCLNSAAGFTEQTSIHFSAEQLIEKHGEDFPGDESEKHLLNSIRDSVQITTLDGTVIFWNQGATDLFGWTRQEMLGQHMACRFPPEHRSSIHKMIEDLGAGVDFRGEYPDFHKDGHPIWIDARVRRILDGEGKPIALMGLATDITARKISEVKLRESEERFRSFFNHAVDAWFIYNEDGLITDVNQAACDSLGYSRDEMLGNNAQLFAKRGDANWIEKIRHAQVEGRLVTLETWYRRKDGSFFPVELRVRSCMISGKIFQLALVRDITERKRHELAIQVIQERLTEAQRIAGIGSWTWELASGAIWWSQESYELFGFQAADRPPPSYATFYGLLHPDDRPAYSQRINGIALQGGTYECEIRVIRRDGQTIWLHTKAQAVRDETGKVIRVEGIDQDITRRKESEAALIQSELKFRTLAEYFPDPIFVVDPDDPDVPLRILYTNQAVIKTHGMSPDELIGKSVLDLDSPVTSQKAAERISRMLAGEIVQFEAIHRHRDGHDVHFEVRAGLINWQGKRAILGIDRDLTERRKSEKALRDSEERFRQSQKLEAVGKLAGGIAHDFNNLLMVIYGHSELLLQSIGGQTGLAESVHSIQDAGRRATQLTKQLLAFSRQQLLEPVVLDVNALVTKAEGMFRPLIRADIRVELNLGEGLAHVKADPTQLDQVLLNLILNACDAMGTGGLLKIETFPVKLSHGECRTGIDLPAGDYISIRVTDSGHGIPENIRSKIFDPFFTTKGIGRGTGLGLAVVHGVVTQSGGGVRVESSTETGTTFEVLLPAIAGDRMVTNRLSVLPALDGGNETILVVEDEPSVRKIASFLLQRKGYRVFEAENGLKALQFAQHFDGSIDLLLTDLIMPELGGRELASRLKQARPEIKVLFISGYEEDVTGCTLDQFPSDILLQKPFDSALLSTKVRELLDAKKS